MFKCAKKLTKLKLIVETCKYKASKTIPDLCNTLPVVQFLNLKLHIFYFFSFLYKNARTICLPFFCE